MRVSVINVTAQGYKELAVVLIATARRRQTHNISTKTPRIEQFGVFCDQHLKKKINN